MVLESEGKLVAGKKRKKGDELYSSGRLNIPAAIMTDSAFPFHPPERVRIIIVDGKLVVERLKD